MIGRERLSDLGVRRGLPARIGGVDLPPPPTRRMVVTMSFVIVLLLATLGYAASYVQGWIGAGTTNAVAKASCNQATSTRALTPGGVTLNVYNSTDRSGLAGQRRARCKGRDSRSPRSTMTRLASQSLASPRYATDRPGWRAQTLRRSGCPEPLSCKTAGWTPLSTSSWARRSQGEEPAQDCD